MGMGKGEGRLEFQLPCASTVEVGMTDITAHIFGSQEPFLRSPLSYL